MATKALGLYSGGLDSRLAVRLVRAAGLEVELLHVETGFGRGEFDPSAAEGTGGKLHRLDVRERYLREVVVDPRYGYGAGMNPCLDCRIFMLREAARVAAERGADFVFTGDVIGQRAIDQSRSALLRIEGEAGLAGCVLRPLSARRLPETRAEREGKIDRKRMAGLHGRSRREQLRMAEESGIESFPEASGGCCLLADPGFARRLRDYLSHRSPERVRASDIELLKRGRHFRLGWNLTVVVGRDETESTWLEQHAEDRWICQVADGRGALALVDGEVGEEQAPEVASLAARYSGARGGGPVPVVLRRGADCRRQEARAAGEGDLARWRI